MRMWGNHIFPKGERVAARSTGAAFADSLAADTNGDYDCPMYGVSFAHRSRNYRHTHAGGQKLLRADGIGYCREKKEAAGRFQSGSVVEIRPDAVHWQGAAGRILPVADREYNGATGGEANV